MSDKVERPLDGECIRHITARAAEEAAYLYDRPVKVAVVIWEDGSLPVHSSASTEADPVKLEYALQAAIGAAWRRKGARG